MLNINKVMSLKSDFLSGLTVALALVPEAVAFALVAKVDPLVGLYAAFMVGLITAVFGGRPGMISGATGALAVVMVDLVSSHGVQYLFASVVLMGIIQILAGVTKLGKFIRIVPHPVMLGFVNGLAIVIFIAQVEQLQITDALGNKEWMSGTALYTMLGLILATMAIIYLLPKLTKAVPSALAAIVIVSCAVIGLDIDTKVVGDVASIAGGLPDFNIPSVPFTWETLAVILPYSFIFAGIGLIESLLTLTLIDDLTQTRGNGNKECVAQGMANTATGFFGGMGGCAMIGQSMINVNSGGRGRTSGITASIALLAFILFASGLIEQIPLAALIGVMCVVVIATFEWSSFHALKTMKKSDAFILVLVSGVTVAEDLAIAVIVGVIVSALIFAWEHAKHVLVNRSTDDNGSTVYEVKGPLFFGAISDFKSKFLVEDDAQDVIVDFKDSRVYDQSGIEAIDAIAERYTKAGKQLHLRHLSPECKALFTKASDCVEFNVMEDPVYQVATDKLP